MILRYKEFKDHVKYVVQKFNATFTGYNKPDINKTIQYYILPSGTQLVLHSRMMADGTRIEFSWEWILAE